MLRSIPADALPAARASAGPVPATAHRRAPTTQRMSVALLLCLSIAAGCGGGADDAFEPTAPRAMVAAAGTAAAAGELDDPAADNDFDEDDPPTNATQAKPTQGEAAAPLSAGNGKLAAPAGDASAPAGGLRRSAQWTRLNQPSSNASTATRAIAATALCRVGFVPPADLVHSTAVANPAAGAAFFTPAELALWRERAKSGPFVADGDFAPSSPGDWTRIRGNAERFIAAGEATPGDDPAARAAHGQLARDAAFVWRIDGSARALAAVRTWLMQQAAEPANDFATQRCFVDAAGLNRDGWYAEAPWLARFVATYDFVRSGIAARDRVAIENFIRRNAWFFAAHLDWGLRQIFPARHAGDYTQRGESAAATGAAVWWTRRGDSNGDCRVDDADDPRALPVYTHVRADGQLGNPVPDLAMWFNNRRAANALAAGAAGVLLSDPDLVERAKRYTMEWLTYGVFGDGSTGEYFRNGEYCVVKQGLIYGAMNVQSGVMLSRLLARQGDRSLQEFATHDGLFGTQSAAQEPKSLARVARTLLDASSGALGWYMAEPWRATQQPRAATALGEARTHYLGNRTGVDTLHELSLLSSAATLPAVAVADGLLKHPLITRPAGSARGVPVDTGVGSWTDALGILPAAYLLRP